MLITMVKKGKLVYKKFINEKPHDVFEDRKNIVRIFIPMIITIITIIWFIKILLESDHDQTFISYLNFSFIIFSIILLLVVILL